MSNLVQLIQVLQKSDIDFVIVGGYSAVLHGSSLVTQDLDVCISFDDNAVSRLRECLATFHPKHRMTPQKLSFLEHPQKVEGVKNLYLETDLGMLDVLGFVGGVGEFERVKSKALEIEFMGYPCHILSIDDLIAAKEFMGRPKDLMAVKELKCFKK